MFKKTAIVLASVGALGLASGCTTTEQTTTAGAVGGAALGTAIGGNVEGAALGALAGGAAGFIVGKSTERNNYCVYEDSRGQRYEAKCPNGY
ncbi:glycine zipper domain-containing protein [Notoacmeibacter ruber]|uniref:Glycine zipper domain-containing protein n=1 Tax=Notoacmeibacter ruber TaxID=2670375 RepID=A0A3L7JDA4_9HYPH|nr:glycine zipper domain-containing protein [Notoacmeibacter ruber]RLQ88656.1 hypothetical protein D8780_10990 [Notoacmeibacter ruber]